MSEIIVNGIVSQRNKQPYIQLDIDGRACQLTMAQAKNIARDIETMCARTEADAMIHKFFSKQGFPENTGSAIMVDFRDFRAELDAEEVEKLSKDPDE